MNWYKKSSQEQSKILYLCRGIPGSGKSTLAKELKGNSGVILENDDFWMQDGKYQYDASRMSEACQWNINRCQKAMEQGVSPIVISNTSITSVGSVPYVDLALGYGYKIQVKEPSWSKELKTPDGKWNFKFLKGKNIHDVPENVLQKMIDSYEPKDVYMKNLKEKLLENYRR